MRTIRRISFKPRVYTPKWLVVTSSRGSSRRAWLEAYKLYKSMNATKLNIKCSRKKIRRINKNA